MPADAQIWEVSRGGLPAANFPLRADLDSALSNITAFVTARRLVCGWIAVRMYRRALFANPRRGHNGCTMRCGG